MLCGDLNGKEIQKRGDVCICIVDSLGCTAETNTTLSSNYTPIKINIKNADFWTLECCLGICTVNIPLPTKSDSETRVHRQDHMGLGRLSSHDLSAILLGAMRASWVVKGSQTPVAGRVRGCRAATQREHCQTEVVVGNEGQLSELTQISTGSRPPHQGRELL